MAFARQRTARERFRKNCFRLAIAFPVVSLFLLLLAWQAHAGQGFIYIPGHYDGKDVTFIGLHKGDVSPDAPKVLVEGKQWWLCAMEINKEKYVWRSYQGQGTYFLLWPNPRGGCK